MWTGFGLRMTCITLLVVAEGRVRLLEIVIQSFFLLLSSIQHLSSVPFYE